MTQANQSQKFVQGQAVEDVITGFRGRVVAVCVFLIGCRQYAVDPLVGADGKALEAIWFDEDRLCGIRSDVLLSIAAPPPRAFPPTLDLGDYVKDRVSGFKGIVTSMTTWFTGARRYGVSATKVGTSGTPVAGQSFDEEVLVRDGNRRLLLKKRAPNGPAADAVVARSPSRSEGPSADGARRLAVDATAAS